MKQREIKFRVWNPVLKEFIDETNLKEDYGEPHYYGDRGYNKLIFLQYTGLKDKNGEEIYEGDIIRVKEELQAIDRVREVKPRVLKFEVKWDESSSGFSPFCRLGNISFAVDFYIEDVEVIGNIMENKDLSK